jgi:uncharacterized membrane protein YgaE (UPF0421/DUF939 family)
LLQLSEIVDRIEWKIAIKTGLSAALGLFFGMLWSHHFQRPETIISGMWSALAAIVVQQAHLGSTYRSAWIRFIGVFIGCAMGGLFTTLLGSNPLSLCLSIILTVVFCSLLGVKDSVRIACLSVAVVMILWGLRPLTNPWQFGFFRFLDSCLGIVAAVLVAHLVWPAKVSSKIGHSVSAIFSHFTDLFQQAVSANQNANYEQLSFETMELLWKNYQYLEDSKLELISTQGLEEWKSLFENLDAIYEHIDSLKHVYKNNLKVMLKDSDLEKDSKEVEKLIAAMLKNFSNVLNGEPLINFRPLEEALDHLKLSLQQFRDKKITRQYDLKDVEGFFVFFYSLKEMVSDLRKMHKHLSAL